MIRQGETEATRVLPFLFLPAPQWYHTRLDPTEHCSPEQLKRVVDAHVEIIEAVDRTPAEKFARQPRD